MTLVVPGWCRGGGFVDKAATDHARDRGCHGFLFSAAGAFVGAAAFGSVCSSRSSVAGWRQLAESAVVGAASGTLLLIFVVLYEPELPAGLSDY